MINGPTRNRWPETHDRRIRPEANTDEAADVWPHRLCLRTERAAIVKGLLLILRAQRRFDAVDQPPLLGQGWGPKGTKIASHAGN
jgi:hypothetical protein